MEAWIEELWIAIAGAEWGTDELLGAVWDLCELVDAGLVSKDRLDESIEQRFIRELHALKKFHHTDPAPAYLKYHKSSKEYEPAIA
jgi:hypothetical protein